MHLTLRCTYLWIPKASFGSERPFSRALMPQQIRRPCMSMEYLRIVENFTSRTKMLRAVSGEVFLLNLPSFAPESVLLSQSV